MKNINRFIRIVLCMALMMASIACFVVAGVHAENETWQNGDADFKAMMSTDKDAYTYEEGIKVRIEMENYNKSPITYDLYAVSPKGYGVEILTGIPDEDPFSEFGVVISNSKTVEDYTLLPDGTLFAETTTVPTETTTTTVVRGDVPKSEAPDTGDHSSVYLVIGLLLAALAMILFPAFNNKRAKSLLTLAICLSLTLSVFALPLANVSAGTEEREFTLTKDVQVDNTTVTISVAVKYNVYVNESLNPTTQTTRATTTRNTTSATQGTTTTTSHLKKIDAELAESFESLANRTAALLYNVDQAAAVDLYSQAEQGVDLLKTGTAELTLLINQTEVAPSYQDRFNTVQEEMNSLYEEIRSLADYDIGSEKMEFRRAVQTAMDHAYDLAQTWIYIREVWLLSQ